MSSVETMPIQLRPTARHAAAMILRHMPFPGRTRVVDALESLLGKNSGRFIVPLLGGGKLLVDGAADTSLFYLGVYAWRIHKFLLHSAKPGDIIFDLGANIGSYTVALARRVGNSGHVYAFEANRSNFELLVENIAINKLPNVTPVFGAVALRSGVIEVPEFKERSPFIGNYSLAMESPSRAEIPSWSVDDFIDSHRVKCVDLMKIDIEGSETNAMRGAQKLLRRGCQTILCEFNPYWLKKMGSSPTELFDLFEGFGMCFYRLDRFAQLKPIDRNFCCAERKRDLEFDVVLRRRPTALSMDSG